jgi:ectoine hydroxylase-related dioxygenase (phytanoyl-CoA dioxygenase family)
MWKDSPMDVAAAVAAEGYAVVPDVIDSAGLTRLIGAIERAGETEAVRSRGGVYAIRNLLDMVPEVGELTRSAAIRALVEPVLGSAAMAVRGIMFDKTPEANWKVAWHQDLTIAVRERIELPGFGPWSTKAGVLHVQPPGEILERMLAVRLHLDDCAADNGPVRVIPGSHRQGRLAAEDIRRLCDGSPGVTCTVEGGGALLMRPLLLHASSAAVRPARRRVIHVEFAGIGLPGGLRWLA